MVYHETQKMSCSSKKLTETENFVTEANVHMTHTDHPITLSAPRTSKLTCYEPTDAYSYKLNLRRPGRG